MIEKVTAVLADIDGTLVNKGEMIMPITKEALEKLHKRGVMIGLATGRKINRFMLERAEDWGLSFNFDMMIGMNGGQLWDRDHMEIESYYMLEPDTMREILQRMAPLNINSMVYEEDHMVALYFDEMIHASMARNHMEVIITDGNKERLCVKPNYNVLFRFDPARTEEVREFAEALSCEKYNAIMTSPGIIEFMDPHVNKGLAVHKFSERNNIPINEIMAFGDMDNDKELLKEAGFGVCLLNGSDITKSMADAVTEYPCTEDGMGRWLEKYVLNSDVITGA